MRPKLTIEQKLKGHCYLRLEDGEQTQEIIADLLSKGIPLAQIEAALSQARVALDEYVRYKNVELVKTLAGAVAVAGIGLVISSFVDDAPGRYRNLHISFFMLAAAIAAYGVWARQQRV
jgi:hypothetical protein